MGLAALVLVMADSASALVPAAKETCLLLLLVVSDVVRRDSWDWRSSEQLAQKHREHDEQRRPLPGVVRGLLAAGPAAAVPLEEGRIIFLLALELLRKQKRAENSESLEAGHSSTSRNRQHEEGKSCERVTETHSNQLVDSLEYMYPSIGSFVYLRIKSLSTR